MDVTTIVFAGQVLGILLALLSVFIYSQKTRGRILITKLTFDALNVVQQSMIGGYTGAVVNGIAILREFVFYHKETKKWAKSRVWLVVFLLLMCSSPIISWQGWVSLLPAIGSSLILIGFYLTDVRRMRILGIFGQTFWLIYGCIIFNLGSILSAFFTYAGIFYGLYKDAKSKKAIAAQKGQNHSDPCLP